MLLLFSDMSYILPELLLRVTQKPKSHLEILNEPVLVTITSGNEADHRAARVKRATAVLGPALLLALESYYRRARGA